MGYIPQTATKLDPQQAQELLTRRTQAATNAKITPKNRQSFVLRAANAVTDFIGARGIAEQFGATGAEVGLRLKGDTQAANLVEHPEFKKVLGSAIQTGANFIPVGAATTLGGKMAIGAATGYAADVGSDLQNGKEIGEALTPGLGTVVGGGLPLAGAAFRQVGKLIGKGGDKIQFSVIKPVRADIEDGFKIDTVKKYNLGGSIKASFEKTDAKLNELSKELNSKLDDATATVDMSKVFERTKNRLVGNKLESFGTNTQLGAQIERLGDEIASIADETPLLPVKDANLVKRAAGHFGAWQYGVADPEAKARERVFNVFYNELKEEIEKQSPAGVKELNQQMHEIIPVMNALIRRIPVAERNNAIGLGDLLTLAAAGVEPRLATLTLANIASKSGTVGNMMSKLGTRMQNAQNGPLRDLITKLSVQASVSD